VGQRTFETRSLYLILAEKLFTLPKRDAAAVGPVRRQVTGTGILGKPSLLKIECEFTVHSICNDLFVTALL
jgi:hypothetical protein